MKQWLTIWMLGWIISSGYAYGDVVNLKNGDKITGDIKSLEGKYLLMKTEYAGTIRINHTKVENFTITHPVNIKKDIFTRDINAEAVMFQSQKSKKPYITVRQDNTLVEIPLTESLVLARINETMPKPSPLKLSGSVNLGAHYDKDSSKTTRYKFAGTFGIRHDLWRHAFKGNFYRKTEDEKTKNYYYNLEYAGDRFFSPQFFWQGAINYQHDWREDIRENFMIGSGPGWQVWENERSALSFATLMNYQRLNYRDGDGRDNPQLSLKWNFDQYFANQTFKFSTFGEIGRSISREVAVDLTLHASISYMLTESLSLNTGLNYEKINTKDGDSRNRNISFGIGYHW